MFIGPEVALLHLSVGRQAMKITSANTPKSPGLRVSSASGMATVIFEMNGPTIDGGFGSTMPRICRASTGSLRGIKAQCVTIGALTMRWQMGALPSWMPEKYPAICLSAGGP
jgi:hypothetical protein